MEDFSKSYSETSVYTFNLDIADVDILLRYINDLYNELKKKVEVIKKVVEYLNNLTYWYEYSSSTICSLDDKFKSELLQILEDKEADINVGEV